MQSVFPIPAFNDNYIWCITSADGRRATVVDPGDAGPVQAHLNAHNLTLEAILVTHHHGDHVGGISRLLKEHDVPVYGPAHTPYGGITRPLEDGGSATVMDTHYRIINVPGHTLDHIAYFADDGFPWPALFCGDTLFACGCGRLFEGSPEQMQKSLARLAALPDDTRIFCAHEYTLANLRFARAVLPEDQGLAEFEARCRRTREEGHPTLPVTLGNEKLLNPFLRWSDREVISAAMAYASSEGNALTPDSPSSVFAAVRRWKDNF